MAEKMWRLQVSKQIEQLVMLKNSKQRESLDLRTNKADIKLF